MRKFFKKKNKGFIALTSTLIISMVLIMLMFVSNTSSFFARFDSLGSEFKRISLGLSESCANIALLKFSEDYNYNLTNDPNYDEKKEGAVFNIGENTCIIKSVEEVYSPSPSCNPSPVKKCLEIKTQARYPMENGALTTNRIKITIQNPAYSPTNPPPLCSFSVYPLTIASGQNVTLNWATSGNATGITIIRKINDTESTVYNGVLDPENPITDTPEENATYTAVVYGSGGESECVSPQNVVVGEASFCSDTVIMLDRTENMDSTGLSKEKNAIENLINLYKTVLPENPKISIGKFGGDNSPEAEIEGSGKLTSVYENLQEAIDDATLEGNSSGGNDLASIIYEAKDELNSSRHTEGRGKALIFISNGKATSPNTDEKLNEELAITASDEAKLPHGPDDMPMEIFTINFGNSKGRDLLAKIATDSKNEYSVAGNTNYRPPTLYALDGTEGWINPSGAQSNGGGYATGNGTQREKYYNFGFTFPDNSIPKGIEIALDAWTNNKKNSCKVGISLSYNGGYSWTSGPTDSTKSVIVTDKESTYVLGGENDLWEYDDWQVNDLSNANFRVRVHKESDDEFCVKEDLINLDYLRVKVYYEGIDIEKENEDNDHFFVVTDPNDMKDVFEEVGKMSCPLINSSLTLEPPEPPDVPPIPSQIEIDSWDEVINILP